MALEAGIVSIIIGLIRGGSLLRIADLKVNRLWLAFIPAVFIFVMVVLGKYTSQQIWVPVTGWLHIAAYIALFVFFWLNRKLPGMKWFLTGWIMNLLPIIANAGKMPVSVQAAKIAELTIPQGVAFRHIEMSTATHFNWLADFIPVPIPLFRNVASPGDCVMTVGIFILIQFAMLSPERPLLIKQEGTASE